MLSKAPQNERNLDPMLALAYRKVGGLRFVRIGRFGFSFWLSRR
jgi:hypothetical protein